VPCAILTRESSLCPIIREVVHSLLPEWASLPPSNSTVSQVLGGITNRIYHVTNSLEDGDHLHVLVRVFGAKGVISKAARLRENSVFAQLAERGVAPALLGVFDNGRIEQWIHARTISLVEMTDPRILRGVAEAMARLHAFRPVEMDKRSPVPTVWNDVKEWMLCAREVSLPEGELSLERLETEVTELRHVLLEESPISPVVFAHNDLLAGNIMVSREDNETVHIIDFEYSGMSYRGFDIGNFFCEAMGGTDDGYVKTHLYPSRHAQELFCRTYLARSALLAGENPSVSETAVLSLAAEATQYGLLAHLYWTSWALAQSATSTIDFPYILFARNRFEEYLRVKNTYIKR
jgi:thiamine kinase-like enzyme